MPKASIRQRTRLSSDTVWKWEASHETSLHQDGRIQRLGEHAAVRHGTLNHLLVGDRIWMRRFTGTGDSPTKLDAILFEDLPSLDLARKAEDERIVRHIDALSDADIDTMMRKNPARLLGAS